MDKLYSTKSRSKEYNKWEVHDLLKDNGTPIPHSPAEPPCLYLFFLNLKGNNISLLSAIVKEGRVIRQSNLFRHGWIHWPPTTGEDSVSHQSSIDLFGYSRHGGERLEAADGGCTTLSIRTLVQFEIQMAGESACTSILSWNPSIFSRHIPCAPHRWNYWIWSPTVVIVVAMSIVFGPRSDHNPWRVTFKGSYNSWASFS